MNYTVTKEELVKNSNQPQQTIENYKKEYDEIEEIQNDFKDRNQSLIYTPTKEDLIQFSRQVLFPNHYGTNPLFLIGITDEVKDELRKFLFPNHYNTNYVYKG